MGSRGSDTPNTDSSVSAQETTKTNNKVKDAELDELNLKPRSVNNDITGKWRISSIEKPIDVGKHAYAYYQNYFGSDDEIHAVVNFTYKTTTKFARTAAGISATVYEHVDGEEHDAKELFSGKNWLKNITALRLVKKL